MRTHVVKLVVADVEVGESPQLREVWEPRDVVVRQVQLCRGTESSQQVFRTFTLKPRPETDSEYPLRADFLPRDTEPGSYTACQHTECQHTECQNTACPDNECQEISL